MLAQLLQMRIGATDNDFIRLEDGYIQIPKLWQRVASVELKTLYPKKPNTNLTKILNVLINDEGMSVLGNIYDMENNLLKIPQVNEKGLKALNEALYHAGYPRVLVLRHVV